MLSSSAYVNPALKAIAIIPKIGGAFSLLGSSLLLRDVGRKWRDVPLTTEVVAHISVANIFISFWECFLSTWMVPKDSVAYMASGNVQTCEAQGFFFVSNYIILETSYAILSLLYWIIVARGWTEQKTQRLKIRFFLLGLPLLLGIGFATALLFSGMYNFSGWFSCFIEEYPLNCDIDPKENGTCKRGHNARYWQAVLFGYAGFCTVIVAVFMTLLVFAVKEQESKSDRYLTKGQEKRRAMTHRALWQAVRYITVFFVSNLPFYIFSVYDVIQIDPPMQITFIYVLVWPMFGVLNTFAYFRPRYLSYREKNKEKSWVACYCAVLDLDFDWLSCRWCLQRQPSTASDENKSLPPRVSDLIIDDDDLASPLFQDEHSSLNSRESL